VLSGKHSYHAMAANAHKMAVAVLVLHAMEEVAVVVALLLKAATARRVLIGESVPLTRLVSTSARTQIL
jgi:hypothetical protein